MTRGVLSEAACRAEERELGLSMAVEDARSVVVRAESRCTEKVSRGLRRVATDRLSSGRERGRILRLVRRIIAWRRSRSARFGRSSARAALHRDVYGAESASLAVPGLVTGDG